jgi:lipid-A-disaccharide synthase-like uncharacterized protein
MDGLWQHFYADDRFLGIQWHVWKIVGWLGNAAFFSRFFLQWYSSEKAKKVVIPVAFWWLSLVGSLLLLAYAVFYQRDSVFIFAYAFTWIPYIRNLVLHKKARRARLVCESCKTESPPNARYCSNCGAKLIS